MKMKRILKSFRPKQQQSAVGTGDLTGSSRRASLDESDDDGSDNDDAEVHYAVADVDDDNTAHNKNNNATRASYDTPVISNAKSATTYDETVESYYNNSEKAATKNGGHRVVTGMPPPPPPRASTRCDETRNLVKKFIADIWNRGELDLIPDVCSPSLRFNGNTGFDRVGHDGLARMVATIRDALDEYHCEIHSMVVEDNKAFCRLRFTGKHVGPLLGYPPTKKTVAWMGATEFTCQNGKILKVWELGDVKSLEEQLANG